MNRSSHGPRKALAHTNQIYWSGIMALCLLIELLFFNNLIVQKSKRVHIPQTADFRLLNSLATILANQW